VEQPLSVGLIGAGPWAARVTGPALAAGPETRVVGVWSRTRSNAEALAGSLGVPAFDDVDRLIDACEAVAVVVVPDAQPELAIKAASAGRTLLLEKPLAGDLDAARAVADAIDAAGVGTLVMLTNRFNPALATFVAEVAAVDPLGAQGCFISGAYLGGPYAQGWRLERGAVLDVGPHLLDLLDAALGAIVDVRAAGDPLGWTSLLCTHASGATSVGAMCCTTATDSRTEVEVYGRRGVARFDGRAADPATIASTLRRDLVAVSRGEPHAANPRRALYLQELIAHIEDQVA
jgi:predicted dehydrogenase